MQHPRFALESRHIVFLVIGAQIATGLFILPRIASEHSGQDAWVAVLLGSLLPLASILLINFACRQRPEASLTEYLTTLGGRWFAFGFILLLLSFLILFEATVVRLFVEISSSLLLPRTPVWMIALLIVLAVVYQAMQGATVVARVNEMYFFILAVLIVALVLVSIPHFQWTSMQPVLGHGLQDIARDSLKTMYSFAGVEILVLYYFMVKRREQVLKAALMGWLITLIIYLTVTVICLLSFGAELLTNLTWPVLLIMKLGKLPVIERMEFFFLLFWLGIGVRPMVNATCAMAHSLGTLFEFDFKRWFKPTVALLGAIIMVVSLLEQGVEQALKWSEWCGYMSAIFGIALPLLLCVIRLVRGKAVAPDG
ncbi:MAG: endospore germination permease [Syntrophomonadaceae bacterium]|nr:endospore germination permease [Syntrophomonadaceae bacterium]